MLDSDLLFPLIIALQPIIFELMLSSVLSEQRYGIAKKRAEGISNFMLLFHVEGVALLHCHTYLRLVVLTEGIQTIGFGTFYCCSLLESIIFPSTVINIGESAFQECSSKGSSGNLLAIFSLGKNNWREETFDRSQKSGRTTER